MASGEEKSVALRVRIVPWIIGREVYGHAGRAVRVGWLLKTDLMQHRAFLVATA
jgi:hypothetical protein